jgi:hypothetical protein
MASSALTSFVENLLQDPAVSYWGKKLSDNGEIPSPRMASLAAAMFNWHAHGDGSQVIHSYNFNYLLQAFACPDLGPSADMVPI